MSRKDKETRRAGDFGEQQRDGQDAETERTGGVQSRSKNDSRSNQAAQMQGACQTFGHGYSPKQITRAKTVLRRAVEWRRRNPDAWAFIERRALEFAARGEQFTMQGLVEMVRKKAFVGKDGKDTKTCNSYVAIFARWLVAEHPETAPYITLRRSVFDILMDGGNE